MRRWKTWIWTMVMAMMLAAPLALADNESVIPAGNQETTELAGEPESPAIDDEVVTPSVQMNFDADSIRLPLTQAELADLQLSQEIGKIALNTDTFPGISYTPIEGMNSVTLYVGNDFDGVKYPIDTVVIKGRSQYKVYYFSRNFEAGDVVSVDTSGLGKDKADSPSMSYIAFHNSTDLSAMVTVDPGYLTLPDGLPAAVPDEKSPDAEIEKVDPNTLSPDLNDLEQKPIADPTIIPTEDPNFDADSIRFPLTKAELDELQLGQEMGKIAANADAFPGISFSPIEGMNSVTLKVEDDFDGTEYPIDSVVVKGKDYYKAYLFSRILEPGDVIEVDATGLEEGNTKSPKIAYITFHDSTAVASTLAINTDELVPLDYSQDIFSVESKLEAITGTVAGNSVFSKMTLKISCNELVVYSAEISPSANWSFADPKLKLGRNDVTVTAIGNKGTTITDSIILLNFSEDNTVGLDLDMNDDDDDGLLNWQEEMFGTKKNKPDTDKDGLEDGAEVSITNTSPLVVDTDNNGISDSDEDPDQDGLINKLEVDLDGNPFAEDTDSDGLGDYEEYVLGTALDNPDTDDDKLSDKVEIEQGTDPLNPDSDGDGILDGDEVYTVIATCSDIDENDSVKPSVTIDLKGEQLESLGIAKIDDSDMFLSNSIPGFISNGFEFNVDGDFESAILEFEFSDPVTSEFAPRIYYFNEEEQLLEELPGQIVTGNSVAATVTHFSQYILLNKIEFDKVWAEEIAPPNTGGGNTKPIDIVFSIDSTGSMSSNDPAGIRKTAAKNFVQKLGSNDNAAVIAFMGSAYLRAGFTNDKAILNSAIDTINNSGSSTSVYSGLALASSQYSDSSRDANRYIIILTDGQDNTGSTNYTTLINGAIAKGVKIYTIGLGTNVNVNLLRLLAESTGGKYYHATVASDLTEIFDDAAGDVLSTDNDDDGLWDVYEKDGMRLGNGVLIKTDPIKDTDDDGLADGEEIQMVLNSDGSKVSYFIMKSDPNNPDSDNDGIEDTLDPKPMSYTVTDRTLSLVAGLSYNNLRDQVGKKISDLIKNNYSFESISNSNVDLLKDAKIIFANESGEGNLKVSWDFGLGTVAVQIPRHNEKDAVILTLRGTEFDDDFVDDMLLTNIVSGLGWDSIQSKTAFNEYTAIARDKGSAVDYFITGHSLGGRLVQDVIYKTYNSNEGFLGLWNKANLPNPTHSATFNSLGYNRIVYATLENDILSQYKTKLSNFYYIFDLVGEGLGHSGVYTRAGTDIELVGRYSDGRFLPRDDSQWFRDSKYHGITYFQNDWDLGYPNNSDWVGAPGGAPGGGGGGGGGGGW